MTLAFLHTSIAHVETFARLCQEVDETTLTLHEVHPELLSATLAAGAVTNAVHAAIAEVIRDLANKGAKLVVCTCSTIGGEAERAAVAGCSVLRVDRPMAEAAVASGRRVVVVAALRSTFESTTALLREVASKEKRPLVIYELFCPEAWSLFEAGELGRYHHSIAMTIAKSVLPTDVVLLAQASMAPAGELVRQLGVPVLSSPRSGVEAAMERIRAR